MFNLLYLKLIIIIPFIAKISDREIRDVTEVVSPKDLQHLYLELDLPRPMVEHAEFGHTDSKLQGRAVLVEWRKQRPDEATKRAVLEALNICHNLEATQALLKKWTLDT